MPAICRQGDTLSTGHSCSSTTTLDIPTQSTVRANGILIARKDDRTVPHSAPPLPPCPNHVRFVNVGSSTVFVVGKAIARIGDSTDSGQMTTGSSNIFAG